MTMTYNEAAYSLKAVAPTLFVSPRRVASPRHPIGWERESRWKRFLSTNTGRRERARPNRKWQLQSYKKKKRKRRAPLSVFRGAGMAEAWEGMVLTPRRAGVGVVVGLGLGARLGGVGRQPGGPEDVLAGPALGGCIHTIVCGTRDEVRKGRKLGERDVLEL